MSINETATCTRCGITVEYMDVGYWAWRGIDGNDMCRTEPTSTGGTVRWPHEVDLAQAQEVFTAFKARTGYPAKHATT
jgi:hypothetical protein